MFKDFGGHLFGGLLVEMFESQFLGEATWKVPKVHDFCRTVNPHRSTVVGRLTVNCKPDMGMAPCGRPFVTRYFHQLCWNLQRRTHPGKDRKQILEFRYLDLWTGIWMLLFWVGAPFESGANKTCLELANCQNLWQLGFPRLGYPQSCSIKWHSLRRQD